MRSKIVSATLICAVAALCCATIAQADGDACEKGFRDSTPAEKARMTAILEIVKRSLPPAPAGWQIGGYEEISVAGNVCRDNETRPWGYNISRTYNRVDDREARDKKFRDAALQANAQQAAKQPRMDAVMKKMEALSARQVALIQKKDFAGAEKLSPEMEKLQNEYKKIADEGNSQALINEAGKELSRDTIMTISVRVNEMAIQKPEGATNFTPPAGASIAQRWIQPGDEASSDEGHAMVLFGTWRVGPPTRWTAPARAGAVPTAAHVIAVEVTGDPARIDPMLQAINFPGLRTAFTK